MGNRISILYIVAIQTIHALHIEVGSVEMILEIIDIIEKISVITFWLVIWHILSSTAKRREYHVKTNTIEHFGPQGKELNDI